MFASVLCVFVCVCVSRLATAGNVRCRPRHLTLKFYEGFCKCEIAVPAVSSILFQSLTPAGEGSLPEFTNDCCRFVYAGNQAAAGRQPRSTVSGRVAQILFPAHAKYIGCALNPPDFEIVLEVFKKKTLKLKDRERDEIWQLLLL